MVQVVQPDEPLDDSVASTIVTAPATVHVILSCPHCGETATIGAKLYARMTKDSDGTGALALRTRAAKVGHVCDQETLGLVEGPRSR